MHIGGSICRMAEHFMTNENFTNGVNSYLKEHMYDNAESKDLWESLTKEAYDLPEGWTIKDIMDTWTTQPGYPVITFDGTTISQQRFFLNASGKISSLGQSWTNQFQTPSV